MSDYPFKILVNAKTHMVVESQTGRCLGGVGSNAQRSWVFPFYTPSGHTVIQEYAFDHPFHNGFYVGQSPIIVDQREGQFWHYAGFRTRPLSGRVNAPKTPESQVHRNGARFRLENVWLDESEEPLIDEIRTVNLMSVEDATVCDMSSQKVASYGAVEYPQTKFGSIGIRVEPRLLPVMGGVILADNNRRGGVKVVHEGESDFVAYENHLPGHGQFGVMMHILDADIRGPWFIRDYGMSLFNPTWTQSISVAEGESWTVSLRVVAYDGELTDERAQGWIDI